MSFQVRRKIYIKILLPLEYYLKSIYLLFYFINKKLLNSLLKYLNDLNFFDSIYIYSKVI